ncbi:hypothetical protein PCE1_003372 [Barthelona sp. PCE]
MIYRSECTQMSYCFRQKYYISISYSHPYSMKLFAVLALCLVCMVAATTEGRTGYASLNNANELVFSWDAPASPIGHIFYEDTLHTVGWRKIHVHTYEETPALLQMRVAGFMEGFALCTGIWDHYNNLEKLLHLKWDSPTDSRVNNWLPQNLAWVRQEASKMSGISTYWYQASLTLAQFEGIVEGYNAAADDDKKLTEKQIWAYMAAGDLLDLPKVNKEPEKVDETQWDHCTGGIRLFDDLSDVAFFQAAWFYFGAMNRVLKHYNMQLGTTGHVSANEIVFSSYPGFLVSFDDFYVLDSNMAVFETTVSNHNKTLSQFVSPDGRETLLTWFRVTMCNRYADNGKEWTDMFARFNSGTYNNQWVVLDYKRFTKDKTPKKDLLWVLEQIPGYTMAADKTDTLVEQGYWPSYNMLSFPEMQELANVTGMLEWCLAHPGDASVGCSANAPTEADVRDYYDYDNGSRAKLFRDIMPLVDTRDDFEQFTRINDILIHPEQHGRANAGIASRYDLSFRKIPFGNLDSKVTTGRLVSKMHMRAISTPTTGAKGSIKQLKEHDLPVWNFTAWIEEHPDQKEAQVQGLPSVYNFDWQWFGNDAICMGITENKCLANEDCGWCESTKKCVVGDLIGPFADCEEYQYASKKTLYWSIVIGLIVCLLIIASCWCCGCAERKRMRKTGIEYERV